MRFILTGYSHILAHLNVHSSGICKSCFWKFPNTTGKKQESGLVSKAVMVIVGCLRYSS